MYIFFQKPINNNIKQLFISILDKFNITEKDSFLDIGCGNGYNLLYVNLRYSFKKIIGLEIDEKTYKLCKHNIDLIHSKKIDIYNINAVNYKIPNDVNYIYLFNPFAKDYYIRKIDRNELASYRKIILNIKNSYLQNPRKIIIIFLNITPINDVNKEISINIICMLKKIPNLTQDIYLLIQDLIYVQQTSKLQLPIINLKD